MKKVFCFILWNMLQKLKDWIIRIRPKNLKFSFLQNTCTKAGGMVVKFTVKKTIRSVFFRHWILLSV